MRELVISLLKSVQNLLNMQEFRSKLLQNQQQKSINSVITHCAELNRMRGKSNKPIHYQKKQAIDVS